MMNEEMTEVIRQLSDKLGTTAEHLWAVLVKQAPISGTIDAVSIVVMAIAAVWVFRFVRSKTAQKDDGDGYKRAEWEDEGAALAWVICAFFCLFMVGSIAMGVNNVVTAFANPEYWALKQLLP